MKLSMPFYKLSSKTLLSALKVPLVITERKYSTIQSFVTPKVEKLYMVPLMINRAPGNFKDLTD
jgi:hypothetical protein